MDGKNAPVASIRKIGRKLLFNSPKMSDVRFLVHGQTLYGHKQILGLGSPVFESMFFGELREQREVIEIEDLTLVGFKNALRYIYGFKINFDLSELHESYRAADKYLAHDFHKEFFEYIKSKLSAENICLIYDQLIKIGDSEEISLAHVRSVIMQRSKKVFESEHFTQIDQETLISLLSLKRLSIAEFDLLVAVSKWVDCEVQRQGLPVTAENRRRVFEPIKGYILFAALSAEKFTSCKETVELIAPEELAPLLLHLLNKEQYPLTIELKTSRKSEAITHSVFVGSTSPFDEYDSDHEEDYNVIDMYLTADRSVSIRTIHTTYSEHFKDLELEIYDPDHAQLDIEINRFVKDGKLSFSLDPPFEVKPNHSYNLEVNSDEWIDEVSEQNLNYEGLVNFVVKRESSDDSKCHCIRGLEFSFSD